MSTSQTPTSQRLRPVAAPGKTPWRYLWRTLLGVFIVLALLIGGAAWFATTPAFENIVRTKLIAVLEEGTGGRVDLGHFRWKLTHLEFEADNVTIHGLEGPGEIPYAHLDRLYVRVKIISFFRHEIGLNYLEGDHPVFHLIIYPDGSTNQPRPKTPTSNKPITDTLFDLAVSRTEIRNGFILLNQQAIPLDLSAKDLSAVVTYSPGNDHYLVNLQASDVTAQRARAVAVHSRLSLRADLARNSATLSELTLKTGDKKAASELDIEGSLTNYSDPHFQFGMNGSVDVREVNALAEVPGLDGGNVELHIKGQGTQSQFTVDGQTKVSDGAYHISTVRIAGASATTQIHVTQDELALTGIAARLRQGGALDGELRIANWLARTPATANSGEPKAAVERGTIRARVCDVSLRTVLEIAAPPKMRDLGFDTFVSGPVTASWTGNADDFVGSANVALTAPPQIAPGRVPVAGNVDATYFNRNGAVEVRSLVAQTPATHLQMQGSMGVYPLARASRLNVTLTTTNLGEFDDTLMAAGISRKGPQGTETGAQALPVRLHGQAQFTGTVTGSLLDPDVQGHLNATSFDTVFPTAGAPQNAVPAPTLQTTPVTTRVPAPTETAEAPAETTIHWDSLDTVAEYSSERISIQKATLVRGKTNVQASGQIHAHQINRKRLEYDEYSALNASVQVQNASISDLLTIAGSSAPVTGTLNLQARAGGTLGNLNGGGHVTVQGGEIYDQAYRSLNTDLRFNGQDLEAANLKFLQYGGQISGDGIYNLKAKTIHFTASGSGFDLARYPELQSPRVPISGMLAFEASGSGPLQQPAVQAQFHLVRLTVGSDFHGNLQADARTDHQRLFLTANGTLNQSQLHASGHVDLTGDYETEAQLEVANIQVEPYLHLMNVQQITASTPMSVRATVTGPARTPKMMNGTLEVSKLAVSVSGVPLDSDGPLHAQLRNGFLHLDPIHITGQDTNLRAQGSVQLFQKPRALDLHANGSVNLKIAQEFNPDLLSSGHMDFNVDATGTMQLPSLTGQVRFTNVAVALQDLPNGLSQINGTLVFDQDRLSVQNLTATTGGGQLKLGGFITYQQGIYGDLTAVGKDIRVRYPQGVSSMADANLRLQGTESNMLLSGNVLITRFSISPNLDLASLSASSNAATPPPDPNAPSNHVRLDVHITSAPELNFQNSYAKLAGDVDLRVRGTIAQPGLLGHISITDGSATFAGTNYQLERGDIYFSNPLRIDPLIDLDATARVEDYDINIGVHGPMSKLNLTYRSEPPLSEADIFALLALGRTQEEQQIYSQEQQAAGVNSTADALLGGALNATLSNRIQRLFGVGSVKIDPTFLGNLGNSTARITVEQQISKNATLTYATNVNSTAQQLIQAQFFVTPNVSLVAQRDENGVFSLMLKIHQRFQ